MKKTMKLALLTVLSLGLVACGGTSSTTESTSETTKPSETTPAVTHTLSVEVKGTTKVDSTITFVATLDKSPIADQASVTYTCSDATAMEINGNKATLKKAGTYTVTASVKASDDQTVTTTFDVEITEGYQYTDIATATTAAEGEIITVKGVVSAIVPKVYNNKYSDSAVYISDNTGSLYVYDYEFAQQVQMGDEVIVSGKAAVFYNAFQMSYPATLLEKTATGVATPEPTYAIDSTIADIKAKEDVRENHNKTYKIHAKLTKTVTSYTKYTLTDSTDSIDIYSQTGNIGCPELEWLDAYVSEDTEYDFAYTINSYKDKWRGVVTYVWAA